MPWKSYSIMDSRLEFVRLAQQGGVSIAELCRRSEQPSSQHHAPWPESRKNARRHRLSRK